MVVTWAAAFTLALGIASGLQARAVEAPAGQGDTDLPTALLVSERPATSNPRQDDLIFRMKTTLRDAMSSSGKFQVHSFIAGESIIKRALNEHLIAADDLTEPHRLDALQRIAHAIGARFILKFATTLDRTEAKTDVSYLENPRGTDWILLADEHVAVPIVLGRMNGVGPKRLTADDIVNLSVDSITARMGIPTHLAGKLQMLPGSRVFDDRNHNDAKAAAKKDAPKKDVATKDNEKSAPDSRSAAQPENPNRSEAAGTQTSGGNHVAAETPTGARRQTGRGKPSRVADPPKGDVTKTDPSANRLDRPARPAFTNEADPRRDTLPAQPAVAPAPIVARPDYEAQAVRYRQTGDLSNTVEALRKAVNERPREVGLRRQLIQAYQARQMPEAAHAEALRALRLDPENATLFKLYGEVLLSEGDQQGALQAFRDGIRADPTNIVCQVAFGDALLAANHVMQALDAYDAASKIDPKSPLPHRRIARASAARAGTDADQYKASLAEVRRASDLTPATDTTSYVEDYAAIMRILETRIHEMLDELQAANQARVQAKRSQTELQRQIADMKERNSALAEYLDKLPPAVGHDVTQAHFVQSNTLLLQAVEFFKDLVEKGDDRFADSMKTAQVEAQRELIVAAQRLTGTKSADKPGA